VALVELIGDSSGIAALREQIARLVKRRAPGERLPALEVTERNDHRTSEPELYFLRGELLAAASGMDAEAEASFRTALGAARKQGSVLFARRAADAFVAYLRERGRATEAEQVLAEAASLA
jgi:hypothetical protein